MPAYGGMEVSIALPLREKVSHWHAPSVGALSIWIYLYCFQCLRGMNFATNKVFGSSRAPTFFVVARLRAKAADCCLQNAPFCDARLGGRPHLDSCHEKRSYDRPG